MERTPDRPHFRYKHVFPIVRIDIPFDQDYPTNTLTVVRVLAAQPQAEAEVFPIESTECWQELHLSLLHQPVGRRTAVTYESAVSTPRLLAPEGRPTIARRFSAGNREASAASRRDA